ncbi:hypothetical protein LX87_03366 [Larkinella arboricola]|uniref:Uncharacterized protein n=1 Tax=Larkinella arboricola TaxID=643671 RepID=A0A327WSK9_LARAB|nr:hypothetical protein [Larkinella arboricola]RAJ95618.1 hypothetical protein LX87_03366 [Larkinella arboricola]
MKTSSRNVFYALIATVLFSACSRPYATYQKMPVEHFSSKKASVTPALPAETVTADVKQEVTPAPSLAQAAVAPSPAAELEKAQQAVDQVVASTSNKVAANKLQKRMARIKSMLGTETSQTMQASANTTVAQKKNLAERLMLKNVDKKIKRALAPQNPNAPKAVNIVVTAGALVALIGLILVLATTSDAIGTTLLVVGLVLLLVGLIV